MIYFTDRREHAIPLFANASILPLTFLHYESDAHKHLETVSKKPPTSIHTTRDHPPLERFTSKTLD